MARARSLVSRGASLFCLSQNFSLDLQSTSDKDAQPDFPDGWLPRVRIEYFARIARIGFVHVGTEFAIVILNFHGIKRRKMNYYLTVRSKKCLQLKFIRLLTYYF